MQHFKLFPLLAAVFLLAAGSPATTQAAEEQGFAMKAELGVSLSGGNTDKKTVLAKEKATYRFSRNLFTLPAHFAYGTSEGELDQKNWAAGLRYDRFLSDSLTVFLGNKWEADKFANIEYRVSIDTGFKYIFYKPAKDKYLFTEAGYRYSDEHRITGPEFTVISHILRIYTEVSQPISDLATVGAWVELLPDLSDTSNFRMNFETNITSKMSKMFSLKVAYAGQFDREPAAGFQKYDYLLTASLLADF